MLDETELEDAPRDVLQAEKKDPSVSLLAKLENSDSKRIAIQRVLSHYETLATGVNNHIFNQKMLMDAGLTKTITLYNTCVPYIRSVRTDGQNSAYCEFEEMAKRWKVEKMEGRKGS